MTLSTGRELSERLIEHVDERRLVDTACAYVSAPSPTGSEQAMAETVRAAFEDTGLIVTWQEVEEGRPNVIGTLEGEGGGQTLMFNGHMDTSYSGREPHLRDMVGFQPNALVRDGRIYGLGISNMKGALACYLEAVRAVRDAGLRLRGDVLIACVVGEIEKTQWGEEFRGRDYRGYAAGSRYLPTHGGIADMCILGEPTEQRVVLGHYGSMWARISTHGPFIHTAFSTGRLRENSIVRMREVLDDVLEWIPEWERRAEYRGANGVVNIGSLRGGYPWRVSRTPNRTDLFLDVRVPPTMRMQDAKRELADLVRKLRSKHPDFGLEYEVFVTAPGAEIDEGHPLIKAIDVGHGRVFGTTPERDVVRWFSDASALTRYGIETVNYGTSSGLPGPDGENLDIEGLVKIATVYAIVTAQICEVAA
jgi:acetylornithine deacetylase/succinyl-diaminopimelate desuccinylase-like protein